MGELVEKRGVQWVPVALELVPGWFQFFGIGHIYQGRAGMGLFIMFSYWGVQFLNALFLIGAWRIWRRPEEAETADKYAVEKKFFALSLAYLFGHFAAFLVEATPWADALARHLGWGF